MASTMISVPTTASRFALLQIDSDSESDASDGGKPKGDRPGDNAKARAAKGGKAVAQVNDKKKDKRKKKKEQQQSEANELRSLAFKKLPQKGPPPPLSLQGVARELLHPSAQPSAGDKATHPENWDQWKQRDEQLTSELYEADLEKALILSKQEFEQHKQSCPVVVSSRDDGTDAVSPKAGGGGGGGKKKKNHQGKEKKMTVTLQDFQAEGTMEQLSRKQEREEPKPANPAPAEDRFFNKVEDDVTKIVQREKRREQFNNGEVQNTVTEHEPDPRAEQLKYELEKKDQEIVKLRKIISQSEVKYKEVKARNAQLLKMLQQGEMKDKAEILLQVDDLLNIKEELSSQVTSLHAALEQEKSKVKGLQSDQPKHQGNRKGKKGLEADL